VYLSQYQLLPYKRIEEYFADQFDLPISAGSLYNFNAQASTRLHPFMPWVKDHLIDEPLLNADETGVNIDGKRRWLHCISSPRFTCFDVHTSRGHEAMDAIGVLPHFTATLCHDHWKPYYRYDCTHALCNAHHLRELERAWEQDGQRWAKAMQELLREINRAVDKAGGVLTARSANKYKQRYRSILAEGDGECPPPDESQRCGKRGRLKRSKARNLLERLRDFEDDALRFMTVLEVPFTNNLGERDIRMTKVHQKISGCFRSFKGAQTFCQVRSYLSTCRKNFVSASEALSQLFAGKWPDFIPLP
jgi:transposase